MIALYLLVALALMASVIGSRQKTWAALKLSATRFVRIAPGFIAVIVLFSVTITLMPPAILHRWLGSESGPLGVGIAALVGSVTIMPGFIAFPLSGALREQGLPYMVLAAFTNSLMMVGILTYPLERQYFGHRVTLVRNAISMIIALIVAFVTGLVFSEISL